MKSYMIIFSPTLGIRIDTMEISWNSERINLERLMAMGQDRHGLVERYLRQFLELVPQRVESLELAIAQKEFESARLIIHQMKPQLHFFGLPIQWAALENIPNLIESKKHEVLIDLFKELKTTLNNSVLEVESLIQTHFQVS